MRILRCAALGSFALLTVLVRSGAGQQPVARVDPNQLRPAIVVAASRSDAILGLVQVFVSDVTTAVQRVDTVALRVLVPDSAVQASETAAARSAGCPSLGQAALQAADRSPASVTMRTVHVNVVSQGNGDTLAIATVEIVVTRQGRSSVVPWTLLVGVGSTARRVRSVAGLVSGLCTVPRG